MNGSLLDEHREQILELARQHGAGNVRVFGSLARGTAGVGSDLDLLVSLDQGRSLLDLSALKLALEELVRRPVDLVTDRGLSPYLKQQILAEAIPL